MSREISNNMSKENEPHFDVIHPLCKVCKNSEDNFKCKAYGTKPKEYEYGKKYDCPNLDLNKNSLTYENIKDKIIKSN